MKKSIVSILFLAVSFLASFRLNAHPGQQQDHQKNYNYCVHGYTGCDLSQLTDTERTQVQQAAHQRNYNNCLHGYYGCDPSKLTDSEGVQVHQAAHQRNYNNCLHGYSGCNPSQLTEAEKPAVQDAANERNYNNCLHGYSGCNPSQLTDSEKATRGSQSTSTPVQNPPPRYYTNKDGQRVQSPTYYDKPPAGATAQCRDGTYSFSQHHQGTCSHHGGVARWLD